MANEIKRIVKINKTKKEIENVLQKRFEKGWDDFFYLISPIFDKNDYKIGEATIAIFPENNKILISVDKLDFPKGNKWQAKIELENYAIFLKELFNNK